MEQNQRGESLSASMSFGQTAPPKPTVGRIVHYQAYGTPGGEYPSVPRAAIVTEVSDGGTRQSITTEDDGQGGLREKRGPIEQVTIVGLAILNPTGMFFNPDVPYSETPKPGHWSWPPRS